MNIKILDSWLREYLETNAKPGDIAKYLSLSGPSVERLLKVGPDYLYELEITSNRVDSASVIGVALEASAILPHYGFRAKLRLPKTPTNQKSKLKFMFPIRIDPRIINRVMAVVLEDVKFGDTPDYIKVRLESAGMRSLNSVVDITNYVMLETGHPTHVFDYDLIKDNKFVFRLSKKGERITSFDGKTYSLPGNDIVIENGKGEIIDLPGIIGTKNSVVNESTKRILFFLDNNDPVKIRKTSMNLGVRTMAAVINEKGVDPELTTFAFSRGVELYKKICSAKMSTQVLDIYPKPYTRKTINVDHDFIEARLGTSIDSKKILSILNSLGFKTKSAGNKYLVSVPSYRALDIQIPEDIVEEVARIYGYHNLPSILMEGQIPEKTFKNTFDLEDSIKQILNSLSGIEVYTPSLVGKEFIKGSALQLKNALGADSLYLRTSLMPSLVEAANANLGAGEPFFLFEIANAYISRDSSLPEEKMTLAAIFSGHNYRNAKGIVESFFSQLNINYTQEIQEKDGFRAGARIIFKCKEKTFAELGIVDSSELVYLEALIENLSEVSSQTGKFIPIPKFPPQVEDVTLSIPPKTKIGDVINILLHSNKLVADVEFTDTYKDSYTFRVWYQDKNKTLDNQEVEKIRTRMLAEIQKKFGATMKTQS